MDARAAPAPGSRQHCAMMGGRPVLSASACMVPVVPYADLAEKISMSFFILPFRDAR